MTTKPTWRPEISHIQVYSKHKPFTLLSANGSNGLIELTDLGMSEVNKVSFVVELGPAYIEFDGTATADRMYVPQDEGYFDDSIFIGSKISILRATSTDIRVRGIIWGR